MYFSFSGRRRTLALILLTSLIGTLLSGHRTYADPPTVLVEATRLEEQPAPDPSPALTVISGHDLPPTTLGETLRDVAGVEVTRSGGPGQPTALFIRGAAPEHTLVLIDGIEVNDPTSTAQAFDFANLESENIERIEIYRGPQSVRFGSGAVGGVVNVVTRTGHGARTIGYRAESGTYQTDAGALALAGGHGPLAYSLGGSVYHTGGFSAADERLGNSERDGSSRQTFSTRETLALGPASGLDFTARQFNARTDLDAGGGAGGDDPNYTSTLSEKLAGLTAHTRFFDGRLRTALALAYTNIERVFDNSPDPVHPTDYHERFTGQSTKLTSTNELTLSETSTLALNATYAVDTAASHQTLDGTNSESPDPHRSALGEAMIYNLNLQNFAFEAGVRHDDLWPAGPVDNFSLAPSYFWRRPGLTARAHLASGFREPSLFQLYSNFGSPTLKAERSTAGDVSLEKNWGDRFYLSLAYFENRYRNLIDFEMATQKYQNISAASSRGTELQSRLKPRADLTLTAQYTALVTRDAATGLSLLRRAGHSFGTEVEWTHEAFSAGVAYRGVGARADLDPITFARTELPFYDVVSANVAWRWSAEARLTARLENAFDRHYNEVAGFGTSGRAIYLGIAGDL